MKTLFVVPDNDAEALKIIEMLERNGQEVAITHQRWGASWEKVEEEIRQRIGQYDTVYGVELKGDCPSENCKNIDHHVYFEDGETDREREPKSSLRQVAELLGVELSQEELFYEANDTGYIPAMRKLGERLGVSEEDMLRIIQKVNDDESRAQGVTEELKRMAAEAVDEGYIYDDRLIWIDLPDFRAMREVTNILHERGKHNKLLHETTVIDTHDAGRRIIVFGKREGVIDKLIEKYPDNSWTGGQEEHGYFGIQLPEDEDKELVSSEMRSFLEETALGYHRLVEQGDIVSSENYGPNLNIHHINDPEVFFRAINAAKGDNDHGAFVHAYDVEDYAHMKLFVVNAGAAGIAVKESGDIVSVFKNPDMAQKDMIEKINNVLLLTALKNGGEKLDCFDGFLPELYSRFGFRPAVKLKFNDEFAPEGWNYDRDGRPDIVFMVHNGESVEEVLRKQKTKEYIPYSQLTSETPYAEDYDDATRLVQEYISERKSREVARETMSKSMMR